MGRVRGVRGSSGVRAPSQFVRSAPPRRVQVPIGKLEDFGAPGSSRVCVNRLFRPRGLCGFGGGDADGGWRRRGGRMEGRVSKAASRGPSERVSFRLFWGCTWDRVAAPAPAQCRGGDFQTQLQLKREHPLGERLVLSGDSHRVLGLKKLDWRLWPFYAVSLGSAWPGGELWRPRREQSSSQTQGGWASRTTAAHRPTPRTPQAAAPSVFP